MAKISHNAKAIAFAKLSVWIKTKNAPNMAKKHSRNVFKLLCAKNGSQKHLIFEKSKVFHHGQNCHNAKAIAFAKLSVWVKIKNAQKIAKKHSRNVFKLLCAKNGSQKHLIFEKSKVFHHGQN